MPNFKKLPDLENAMKSIIINLLHATKSEVINAGHETLSLPLTNPQLQVALLTLSEIRSSITTINETTINEIAAHNDSWISNIGLKALFATSQKEAVDIETQLALTNMSELFETSNPVEKLALCLNVAAVLSEKVKFCTHYWPKKRVSFSVFP